MGGAHPARLGVLPWPAHVAHQHVREHQWERFARDHETWSSTLEPHPDLPLQEWVERTLQILCEAVGPPVGTADIQVHNDVWTTLMARKCRWAARQGFDREVGQDPRPVDLEHARRRVRWRKGGQFAPISALRDGRGRECTGVDLLQELPRQMEAKQGRLGGFFSDEGAGPSGLDYTLGELQRVVRGRKPSAPGKSAY